jgi:hypothetical protein
MIKGLSALCMALLSFVPSFAQDQQDVSQFSKKYTLSVKLNVLDKDGKTTDTRETSKVTISGQPVSIKLDGKAIKGMVSFTIYAEKGKPMLLFAQAQLLVMTDENREGQFVSILKSIPFTLGQKIEFYPLGKGDIGTNNIMFEIKIDESLGVSDKPNVPEPRLVSPPPGRGNKDPK